MKVNKLSLLPGYEFLFDNKYRYKVVYGGRGSGKSTSCAKAAIAKILNEKDTHCIYGCYREKQNSLSESIKALLVNTIADCNLEKWFYTTRTSNEIVCLKNKCKFVFDGVKNDPKKIKSTERLKFVWLEEADPMSQEALDLIIPTLRMPKSEMLVSFNPNKRSDAVYEMFVDGEVRPDAIVKRMNFDSNPLFPAVLETERLYCLQNYPKKYRRIWLGEVGNIEGQLLHPEWWQYYTNVQDVNKIITGCFVTADTAYKKGTMNDYSAIQFWGYNGRRELYLLNQLRAKLEFPELVRQTKDFVVQCSRFNRIVKPSRLFVENKASGPSLVQTLKRQGINAVEWNPKDYKYPVDKVGRVNEAALLVENGRVFIPKYAKWTNAFVDECSEFSEDENAVVHDDQVDALTMACSVWRAYGGGIC